MVVLAHYPLGETRVQREAEALVDHGYKVDVICLGGREYLSEEHFQGVQIYRLPVGLKKTTLLKQFLVYIQFFILAMIKVIQLHQRHSYHTVQVHNLPDFLVFCVFWPKLRGVPIILDLHDLMPEFYSGRFGVEKTWLLKLIRWQERVSCWFADHVITVSEHWRRTLIQRGVPEMKCSVVMNVADEKIFYSIVADTLPQREQNRFHLIYHGTIVYRYGLDLAVKAVEQVKDDIPRIHLTMLGDGDYISDLCHMVKTLSLDEYVTILDELRPAEELPEFILTADVGVVPYRNDVFTDGLLPTKLMEYAALDLPCIAAKTTAIEAYFADTMVELFEPDNVDDLVRCIRLLYQDQDRMQQLTEGCRKFKQQYNWTEISAEYVALVENLGSV